MDFAAARRSMVENQIRPNRITDPLIIAAMESLPREAFVPKALRGIAYVDEDIALGEGRYLMEPLVTAQLVQAADIAAQDIVLIVGCATGYAAALTAHMAGAVVALDSSPALCAEANRVLTDLGLDTVAVVEGPLAEGYPRQAPYDVIVFGGAISAVPEAIAGQLAEGGRMVAVIADERGQGKGTLLVKIGGTLSRRQVFDAATPFLPGFEPQHSFEF